MEGRISRASSHAFIIRTPNIPGARSYQCVAGGSVATRCRWLLRALQAPAFCDAASCRVLGAIFIDLHDSFGHFNPETWLSGGVHASL